MCMRDHFLVTIITVHFNNFLNANDPLYPSSKLDPISLLLSSFSDAEHTIDAFKAQNLQYSNLASLNKVDLELLGITNEETQKNMLKDFGSLPKQDDHYEK